MKPVQLILIGVALLAAVGAGLLMMNISNKPAEVVVQTNEPVITIPLVDVLIAHKPIPQGTTLGEDNIKWDKWPKLEFVTLLFSKTIIPKRSKNIQK